MLSLLILYSIEGIMQREDESLDEITYVINKLEGKLKDDRLSEELRNSNVTIQDQKPMRYAHEYVNQVRTNYHPMRQQVVYQNHPPPDAQQYGYTRAIPAPAPSHQNVPYQAHKQLTQSLGPGYVNQRIVPNSSPDLSARVKNLEQRLKEYEGFQSTVKQNNKRSEQQFQKLINIINYQQNEIISLQSQNNQIQHQLRQALETQRVYEEELVVYKHKVVGFQRALGNNERGRDTVLERVSKNEVFKDMMRGIDGKSRVGSPNKPGITLSSAKK